MKIASKLLVTSILSIALLGIGLFGCGEHKKVAVLFVAHGEPAQMADGFVPTYFWDGSGLGPAGVDLGVPAEFQNCTWAGAFEEIATTMTYIFGDFNGNGIMHEVAHFPFGDVPPWFTWGAFTGMLAAEYAALGDYSPHVDLMAGLVNEVGIGLMGKHVDKYISYLDAYPRIPDALHEIAANRRYKKIVVVPMLLSKSTHTQDVAEEIHHWAALERPMQIVITEPFFEMPLMRENISKAIAATATNMRAEVPASVLDEEIGVLVASHGTPYVPPYAEFGYQAGDIYSHLNLTEDEIIIDINALLPWDVTNGRNEFVSPTIENTLAYFEAEGKTHVMVVPGAFPTAAIHTMWDVAEVAVMRPVLPQEGVVTFTRPSGMVVYFSAQGYADTEPGKTLMQNGLRYDAEVGLLELFERNRSDYRWLDR